MVALPTGAKVAGRWSTSRLRTGPCTRTDTVGVSQAGSTQTQTQAEMQADSSSVHPTGPAASAACMPGKGDNWQATLQPAWEGG